MSDMEKFVKGLTPGSPKTKRLQMKGFTIYVKTSTFQWIESTRGEFGLTRQAFVEALINGGVEAFKAARAKRDEEEN